MFYDHNTYQSVLAGAPVNNFWGQSLLPACPARWQIVHLD